MKNLLNKTIKVKHLLLIVVLLFAAKFFLVVNRPHFPRHKQMAKIEHRGERNQRPDFRRGNFKHDFKDLSEVEKASIDSLKSLLIKGDRENNVVIFKQIRGIVKQ